MQATPESALRLLAALELDDAQVARVIARHRRGLRRRRLVVACVTLGAAVVVAVPIGGAGAPDAVKAFLSGGEPPGDPIPAAELPAWLEGFGRSPRVAARVGTERMLVYRAPSGAACFEFGGVGLCTPYDDLLDDAPVELFGPAGRLGGGGFVLWGVATNSVATATVTFADGSSTTVPVHSAFGVRLDREPRELVASDADGNVLARFDLRWRWEHRPAI